MRVSAIDEIIADDLGRFFNGSIGDRMKLLIMVAFCHFYRIIKIVRGKNEYLQ